MSATAAIPKVSVVVPVRNGGPLFERCLRSVVAQEYPRDRLEILVVDNGSTDGSFDTAERLGLLPLRESRPGAAHARNRGLAEAKGDIVAFADADSEVEPSWVGRLVEALAEADAVTGRIEPFPSNGRFARARAALHGMYQRECIRLDRENRLDRLDSANAAAWRWLLDEVGGFDPQIFFVEDRELAVRIVERGRRLRFAAAPLAFHHFEERILRSMRKAVGTGRMWAKLPDLVSAEVLQRHFSDVEKLLAAARPFASPWGRRHLLARFWLHVAAAVVGPRFASCLHHFRAGERIATLRGILGTGDELQAGSQTNR
jgi:glycosyltransferase involved in cell wall biosynthesis